MHFPWRLPHAMQQFWRSTIFDLLRTQTLRPTWDLKEGIHEKNRIWDMASSISWGSLLAAVCVHSGHAHKQSILETCGRNRYPQYVSAIWNSWIYMCVFQFSFLNRHVSVDSLLKCVTCAFYLHALMILHKQREAMQCCPQAQSRTLLLIIMV